MNKFKVLLVLAPTLLSGALAKEDLVRGIEDHHFKSTLNRKLNLFGESKCGCFSIDDCGACLLPAWLESGSTCAEICEGAECKVAKCDDSLGCYTEDMADNTPCDDGDLWYVRHTSWLVSHLSDLNLVFTHTPFFNHRAKYIRRSLQWRRLCWSDPKGLLPS